MDDQVEENQPQGDEARGGVAAPLDEEARLRSLAEARIGAKKAFWASVGVFVLFNVISWTVWAVSGGWRGDVFPWPVWLLVWGVFIAWNGFQVFGPTGHPVGEAQVRREMDRLRGH